MIWRLPRRLWAPRNDIGKIVPRNDKDNETPRNDKDKEAHCNDDLDGVPHKQVT